MSLNCIVFTSTMIATILVLLFRFINQKYVSPVFGVYQRRNKYYLLKFAIMYVILRLKQLYAHLKRISAVELGYSHDGTVHIHEHDVALEKVHDLGDYPKSVDAVYFNGTSKDGAAFIAAIARRPKSVCDTLMFLKIKGEDLLIHPNMPDTVIKQTPSEEGEFKAGGISVRSFIPMRSWKVSYNGDMKYRNNPEKTVKVTIDLTWSANWPSFNYDTDLSPLSLASCLARETWSSDYFKLLKQFHQTHYEQMGFLSGSVLVDDEKHTINMPCVRDHSFGKLREWRNFHRYILQFIYLENGDCIEIGIISQPIILSHLTIGYLCRKSDQAIIPVSDCDFCLWQHGENQIMPKDYGFCFTAGGQRYDVKVKVDDEDFLYIGKERVAKIYERWATVEVNGIKGWGCLEWQYNNEAAVVKQ